MRKLTAIIIYELSFINVTHKYNTSLQVHKVGSSGVSTQLEALHHLFTPHLDPSGTIPGSTVARPAKHDGYTPWQT